MVNFMKKLKFDYCKRRWGCIDGKRRFWTGDPGELKKKEDKASYYPMEI